MTRYPALIDGETGACGVTFPDLPGIVAMGATLDEAMLNAEEALRDYATETEKDGRPLAAPRACPKTYRPPRAAHSSRFP